MPLGCCRCKGGQSKLQPKVADSEGIEVNQNPYEPPATTPDEADEGRAALVPVAIALLTVSALWFVMSLFGIAFFVASATSPDADLDDRHTYLTYSGYLGAEAVYCCILATGAFSMIRRGSFAWVVTTALLACVPCLSPFYVVGIPIGIWALVVLRRPGVNAAFRKL